MTTHTITAAALYEGTYSVGTDKEFIRIDRNDPPRKASLKLSLNAFLIKNDGQNILIDAGPGFYGPQDHHQMMVENLAENGLSVDDITDVFCSHLHSDHIGGLAHQNNGEWALTFPNAKVWVQADDWAKAVAADTGDDLRGRFIQFINQNADLQYLKDGDHPYPEIQIEVIGGHTKYSLAIYFESGSAKYMMAGDVLASEGSVNRKFAAKYDFDGKQSMQTRTKLAKKAYEEGFTILAYHSTKAPMFRLTDYDERKGYAIEAVS